MLTILTMGDVPISEWHSTRQTNSTWHSIKNLKKCSSPVDPYLVRIKKKTGLISLIFLLLILNIFFRQNLMSRGLLVLLCWTISHSCLGDDSRHSSVNIVCDKYFMRSIIGITLIFGMHSYWYYIYYSL